MRLRLEGPVPATWTNIISAGAADQSYGTTITISAGAETGDYLEFVSDGTYYFVTGVFGTDYFAIS